MDKITKENTAVRRILAVLRKGPRDKISLLCGILAYLSLFLFWGLGIVFAVAGTIFGFWHIRDKGMEGSGAAAAGIVLSLLLLLIVLLWFLLMGLYFGTIRELMKIQG